MANSYIALPVTATADNNNLTHVPIAIANRDTDHLVWERSKPLYAPKRGQLRCLER